MTERHDEPWRGRGEPPPHVTRVAHDEPAGRSTAERGETGECNECGQVRTLWRWIVTPWGVEPGPWRCFYDLDAVSELVEVADA